MEAYLYDRLEGNEIQCNLCHHRCTIKPGKRGICHVRENHDGTLETLVFGKLIARNIDPIEKKPVFHLYPGSLSYSVATVGCNFRCSFCQNADISQMPADQNRRIPGDFSTPEAIVQDAERSNCKTIAYTYTEPTVFFEFALETSKLAHQKGILNVFVTNGYMSPEALEKVSPWLDAANVDLKAFTNDFYKKYCGAKLEPVKETLKGMKQKGIWVEITTLLIPGLNDDPAELKSLAKFIVESLGAETPWHISRFHPTYRLMDISATPVATLINARNIGMAAGLKYVYTGNVPGDEGENTFCHQCKRLIIERWGFRVGKKWIQDGKCLHCNAPIHGVGM